MSLPPPSLIASAMKRGRPKHDFMFEVHTKKCNRFGDDKLDYTRQIRMNLKQLDRHMDVYNKSRSAAIVDFLHSTAFVRQRNDAEEELDNDAEVISNVETSDGDAIL
eukprot:4873361-Ditylum_brightwellii.AAC.1